MTGLYRYEDMPPGELSIGWTAVHPDLQGKGIGTAMLQLALTLACQHGADTISVFLIEGDPYYAEASRLYTKGGFEKIEEVVTFDFQLFGEMAVPVTWRKLKLHWRARLRRAVIVSR